MHRSRSQLAEWLNMAAWNFGFLYGWPGATTTDCDCQHELLTELNAGPVGNRRHFHRFHPTGWP
jgi:hypothetical protein